jgi:hypothetical protein
MAVDVCAPEEISAPHLMQTLADSLFMHWQVGHEVDIFEDKKFSDLIIWSQRSGRIETFLVRDFRFERIHLGAVIVLLKDSYQSTLKRLVA